MLALGMAFIEQPRLLMIDELSLGLAPTIVEQLLPLVRDIAAQGTTVILVEQSVNLALDDRGDRVLHGEGRDPLPRPDRRAARTARRAALGVPRRRRHPSTAPAHGRRRPTCRPRPCPSRRSSARPVPATPATRRRRRTRQRARRARRRARDPPRARQRVEALRRARGAHRRLALGDGGRDRRLHRPERRGQDHAVRRDLRLLARRLGHDRRSAKATTRVDITRMPPARRARLGLGRSFQDGRLFPSLTVAETIALAFERHLEVRDPIGAALHLPFVADAEADTDARRRGAARAARHHRLPRQARRASSRPGAGASSTSRACSRTDPSVLLLDEPSSGIAQREAEALGPLLLRIREQTGATLLVIEHDVPLLLGDRRSPDRARPRRDRRRAAVPTTSCTIRSSCSRTSEPPKPRSPAVAFVDQPDPRRQPNGANTATKGDHHGHTADPACASARRWHATHR